MLYILYIINKFFFLAPATPSCGGGLFPCDGSRCIPASKRCNQHKDCYDGTDEEYCDNSTLSIQVSIFTYLFKFIYICYNYLMIKNTFVNLIFIMSDNICLFDNIFFENLFLSFLPKLLTHFNVLRLKVG